MARLSTTLSSAFPPAADGQWGSVERIAPDTALAAAVLPGIAVRMADLD